MNTSPRLLAFVVVLLCAASLATGTEAAKSEFVRDVRPILERCIKCHGPEKQQGGLRFDSRAGALVAGDTGSNAITPGNVDKSEIIRRIEAQDDSERMPPEGESLSREQINVLRTWIKQGAHWPETHEFKPTERGEMVVTDGDRQHWSYRPLRVVDPPTVKDAHWCATKIDRFVMSAMAANGLHPNQEADRRTLIRRLYFDLIGLPPSPRDVEAFVADPRESAYEELVEKLLDNPHYGERWGRHWLDLTRYADSDGLETDADRSNAYHYRDFVIRAFNDDLAYSTFVRWQLAGDEYEPDDPRALAATGFLATAPCEMLSENHLEEERLRLRFNELDDTAVTTAAAFLGLTLGCARCHDHKFDAIPTRDYYRLQSAFIGTARGNVFLGSRDAVAKFRRDEAAWTENFKPIQKHLDDWLAEQQRPHAVAVLWKKIDSQSLSNAEKTLLKEQPDSEEAKRLSRSLARELKISDNDFRRVFTQEQNDRWDALKKEVARAQQSRPQSPPTALAITESTPEPHATWLLARGDFYAKQERVELGFLSVLTGSRAADDYWASARREGPPAGSSHQRRALAQWMTDVEHGAGALLARVIVNRVWQHHFGEGLSRTANDFGVRSERPSHPELLEWLAHDIVEGGWRLKRLHKQILMSSVYRQDTSFDATRAEIDPENRFLWRRRPRRLEAEIVRDSVLAVSGTLNTDQFGPAFKPPIPPEAMLARNSKNPYPLDARDTPATRRRSVYMFHKRVVQHPFMQVFDGPDASASCGKRNNTIVAPQALTLLNDPLLRERAMDFAKRLMAEGGSQHSDWITHGFRLALGRPPSDAELHTTLEFLDRQINDRAVRQASASQDELRDQALADFCQSLFGLNEFIYVD